MSFLSIKTSNRNLAKDLDLTSSTTEPTKYQTTEQDMDQAGWQKEHTCLKLTWIIYILSSSQLLTQMLPMSMACSSTSGLSSLKMKQQKKQVL